MMAAILNSSMLESGTAILDSDTLLSSLRLTQKHSALLTLTQTNSIWLIWDGSHLEICHLGLRHFAQKNFTHSHSTSWLANLQFNLDSNSFILTQLDDVSHLEFCHLGFSHCHLGFRYLVVFSQIHSKTLSLHIWLWLIIQSDSTWWWQPSWILPSWIQPFSAKKTLHSFILTQLDDGSHLEFFHVRFWLPTWI